MPTRTSSPPGSRSSGAASGGSGSTRARSSTSAGSRSTKGSSSGSTRTSKRSGGSTALKARPAPRAVRNGPGPVSRLFRALGRGLKALWLGIAHALGAVVRRIGSTARDLDPEHRRGVLGLVHLAHGSPRGSDTAAVREAGGAVGFVVGSLATDLLHSAYVVVPLLILLAFFGVLVITATPLYRVPDRLASLRDRLLGRRA